MSESVLMGKQGLFYVFLLKHNPERESRSYSGTLINLGGDTFTMPSRLEDARHEFSFRVKFAQTLEVDHLAKVCVLKRKSKLHNLFRCFPQVP